MTPGDPTVIEQAPSEVRSDEPTLARIAGAIGLALALLGIIAIIANQYGPRFVGTGGGYLFAALGLAAVLFHALRDGDVEFRRAYGGFGLFFLVLALLAAIVPGPLFSEAIAKTSGYNLLPWSPTFGLLGLAFLVAPLRRETEAHFRNITLLLLLGVGAALNVGSVVYGIAEPDSLVGPGILFAFVGLAYLAAFMAHTDCSEGLGYFVAVGLGMLGFAALSYALARSIWPTVLFDGPAAIKNAFQTTDYWKLAARVIVILAFLSIAALGWRANHSSMIVRACLMAFGVAFAGVILYGTTTKGLTAIPKNYFVPFGLLLCLIGIINLIISLAVVSENAFVALVRRELAAFFFSPIAYILMAGMVLVSMDGYGEFLGILERVQSGLPEPILEANSALLLNAAFAVLFIVPALTMRSFSEEKRNATLEVLLTAPVSETSIVLSKFFACWIMYMLTFAPAGLYLIALRAETGVPFDYRPLLSYYLAVGACGVAFIGMGLFFSSLTKNQIISAAMCFVGMLILLLTIRSKSSSYLGRGLQAFVSRFDYLTLWSDSLSGVLTVTHAITYVSLGVFWLFLTVKVLEARKWG